MSAGCPPANGTGEPTMSTRYRTGSAGLTSSITVAGTSARPLAGTLGCGAGATLRGKGDESPQGRATHTHGGRRTTSDTCSVRTGLVLMLPPLG